MANSNNLGVIPKNQRINLLFANICCRQSSKLIVKIMAEVTRLEGKKLLDFVKERSDLTEAQKAVEAGYASKSGRALSNQFNAAIIRAVGINLESSTPSRRGRIASTIGTVQSNGAVAIGQTHVRQLGLKAGDKYEIYITPRGIRVVPYVEKGQAETQGELAIAPSNSGVETELASTDLRQLRQAS